MRKNSSNNRQRRRKRDLYLKKIREWRTGRTRSSLRLDEDKKEAEREKRLRLLELHKPLNFWPITRRMATYKRSALVELPEIFSFIDNPNETLRSLYDLRDAIEERKADDVFLNHGNCRKLDLCASVVTDVLVLRGRQERLFRGTKFGVGGSFSEIPEVNALLMHSGILKQMEHPAASKLPKEVRDRLLLNPLFTGKASRPDETTQSELAASRMTRFFDNCLLTENYELRVEWKSDLISLITEVIDNAEQHAHTDRFWHTIAFFNRLNGKDAGGECHIVMFNFGDSIYDSLKRKDTPKTLKDRIGDLAALHARRGFFSLRAAEWDEETLWTLYALQEGVSRFNDIPGHEDRGNGTIRLIEFFNDLAGENPRMAMISGSTYILFDGTYKLKTAELQGGHRKIIAFNHDNDLTQPPDANYVKRLELRFPGTLVSMRFKLNRKFLKDRILVVNERDSKN